MKIRYLRFKDLQTAGIVNNRVTLSRWIKQAGFTKGVLFAVFRMGN